MTDVPGMTHKNEHRAPIRPLNAPTLALSTLGLGFLRPAPGTWGSVPPPVIAFVLMLLGGNWLSINLVVVGLLLLGSAACVGFGRYAETRFGLKDAPEVVADETAGVCLPLLLWPALPVGPAEAAAYCAGAFVLFRIFDIIKPWPVARLEKLPHGWGVLVDDLMAGIYAMIAMQLILRLVLPALGA